MMIFTTLLVILHSFIVIASPPLDNEAMLIRLRLEVESVGGTVRALVEDSMRGDHEAIRTRCSGSDQQTKMICSNPAVNWPPIADDIQRFQEEQEPEIVAAPAKKQSWRSRFRAFWSRVTFRQSTDQEQSVSEPPRENRIKKIFQKSFASMKALYEKIVKKLGLDRPIFKRSISGVLLTVGLGLLDAIGIIVGTPIGVICFALAWVTLLVGRVLVPIMQLLMFPLVWIERQIRRASSVSTAEVGEAAIQVRAPVSDMVTRFVCLLAYCIPWFVAGIFGTWALGGFAIAQLDRQPLVREYENSIEDIKHIARGNWSYVGNRQQ
jgi:hypothetical protein